MTIPYSIKRNFVIIKQYLQGVEKWLKDGWFSVMKYMREDWGVNVYVLILLIITNKEKDLNDFIIEHVGDRLNGILGAVEGNIQSLFDMLKAEMHVESELGFFRDNDEEYGYKVQVNGVPAFET